MTLVITSSLSLCAPFNGLLRFRRHGHSTPSFSLKRWRNKRAEARKGETSRDVPKREGAHRLNHGAADPQSPASGGYLSLVVHIWVGEDGRVIRGTVEDAHTGARLAIDFSALAALFQESLASARVLTRQRRVCVRGEADGGSTREGRRWATAQSRESCYVQDNLTS